jgi:hypothetical protein
MFWVLSFAVIVSVMALALTITAHIRIGGLTDYVDKIVNILNDKEQRR